MEDKYLKRGVSAGKEEVHKAVKDLYHGLYPKAFCKIYPDYLGGDESYCNVMSSDGSGTKSILAYLYWKETGDISVWRGIAQDAIVMNTDDLACVGAVDNFLYTSVINRNKNKIPGEVIAEIIKGSALFVERMRDFGVNIHAMGGETADLGDCVRTTTVDAAISVRMKKSNLIITDNIRPGDVVIGLASYGQAIYEDEYNSGISSNGLTSARHDLLSKHYADTYPESFDSVIDSSLIYSGNFRMTDNIEAYPLNVGKALLSPTRTYVPVIKKLTEELPGRIHGIVNCTGGAHTKVLHYINGLRIIKNNLFPIPKLFRIIQEQSGTDWREMFKVLNCGTRLEVYVNETKAKEVIDIALSFGIDAQIIGYVEASNKPQVEIHTAHGNFSYN